MYFCNSVLKKLNKLKLENKELILDNLNKEEINDLKECGFFIIPLQQENKTQYLISENYY